MWSPCASVTWPCEGQGALGTPAWLLPRAVLEASSAHTSQMGVGGVLVVVWGGRRGWVSSQVLSAHGCGCHKAFTGFLAPPRRATSYS